MNVIRIGATIGLMLALGNGCNEKQEPAGFIESLGAQIVHGDGSTVSGVGELWYSPRAVSEVEEAGYDDLFEEGMKAFFGRSPSRTRMGVDGSPVVLPSATSGARLIRCTISLDAKARCSI